MAVAGRLAPGRWMGIFVICALCVAIAAPVSGEALRSAPLSSGGALDGMVRVSLSSLGQPARLDLTVQGEYSVSGAVSRHVPSGSRLAVTYSSSSGSLELTLGGETLPMGGAFKLRRHSGTGQAGFRVAQGRAPNNLYPADLFFTVSPNGSGYTLSIVAYVFIEDYLYGVLPYEMGNASHMEALKAQAVTARTYTLRRMGGSGLYDVVDTTSDQVYAGTPSGNENCRAAVDATRGIVMKTGGSYTATFYTASNGGQTESARNLWGSAAYPYLGVRDDPYDLANPQSAVRSLDVPSNPAQMGAQLKDILLAKARALTGRQDITLERVVNVVPHSPMYPAPSRLYTRADFAVNLFRDGEVVPVTLGFDLFSELEKPLGMGINSGNNELWSVIRTDTGFTLSARRYGHGIGMSQRGAMHMGSMGYTYDQVIAFYFPGCQRVSYAFTRSILSAWVPGAQSSEETDAVDPAEIGQESSGKGLVEGGGTPVYQKADATSPVLTLLPKGAWADILTQRGDFYGVRYGALTGFVKKDRLAFSGTVPDAEISGTSLNGYGTVINTGALNLRSNPSAGSSILMTVPGGTVLPILSLSGEYALVQYGLQGGFVHLDFLDRVDTHPGTAAAGMPQGGVVRALGEGTPLRSRPGTSSYVIRTLRDGESVAVLSLDSAWAEVQSGVSLGFVLSRNVELTGIPAEILPDGPGSGESLALAAPQAGSLNLRSQASLESDVILEIPRGDELVLAVRGAEWSQVRYRGIPGFVMTAYLGAAGTPAPTQPPTETGGALRARVLTPSGSLNLREGPSPLSRVLRTIPRLTEVSVTSRNGDWCGVVYEGTAGQAMAKYLEFLPGQPSVTATPAPGPTPGPSDGPSARVATPSGSLNFRDRPEIPSTVLMTIPKGADVAVLQRGPDWCRVSWMNATGYVQTRYLAFEADGAETPEPLPDTGGGLETARVNTRTGSLNLRESASLSARRLASIPQNDHVRIIRRMEPWTQCSYEGLTGYVMSVYLSFGEGEGTELPSPPPVYGQPAGEEEKIPPENETNTVLPDDMRDPSLVAVSEPFSVLISPDSLSLNLRRGCSLDSALIMEMPRGDSLLVLARGDTWCYVTYEGREGYCMGRYLSLPPQ